MKNTYIVIIVLVLIVAGVFFFGMNKRAIAPIIETPLTSTVKTDETSQSVKEFTVSGQNFSFTPNTMTVKKGDKVKVTFKNMNGNHNFTINEFNVATNTIKGGEEQTVEFVADKTGSFQYYCSVVPHRSLGMWGTLTVN